MAFKILEDHIADLTEPEGTNLNAVGVMGPRGISVSDAAALDAEDNTTRFKMYDDDGELYYTGVYLGDPETEDAFEPLDCFGTPNAGAVRIEYLDPATGQYNTL